MILATDGDFNVGESSDAAMVRLIEERRDQGIFLTVLGFGTGNLKDSRMEQIADKGNGHYAYVDNLNEARRVFVREFAGTLVTIAKDVKIQVEFNPAQVAAYRLIGYENRALAQRGLRRRPQGRRRARRGPHGDGAVRDRAGRARRSRAPAATSTTSSTRRVQPRSGVEQRRVAHRAAALQGAGRHDQPAADASRSGCGVPPRSRRGDFRFAAAVAAFGLVLRESEYRGTATLDQVLQLARGAEGRDSDGERAEFVRLVESARLLSGTEGEEGGL